MEEAERSVLPPSTTALQGDSQDENKRGAVAAKLPENSDVPADYADLAVPMDDDEESRLVFIGS